jgi:ribosomal-protein-serine acetyltransferase
MQVKEFSKKIVGARVVLKKHEVSFKHAEEMFALVDGSRDHLLPWLQWVLDTKKPEDSFEALQSFEQKWVNKKEFIYAIYMGKKYLGNVGFHHLNHEYNSSEIGYFIGKDFAHQGFMSEAVRLMEKEFFTQGGHRLVIKCDEKNLASSGVAKKCGFKLEGKQVDAQLYKGEKKYRTDLIFVKFAK